MTISRMRSTPGAWHWRQALWAFCLWMGLGASAWAADPVGVSNTLEGCRNDGTITLPAADGRVVCPTGAYTSGNLGKGWNELDLVPYRITLDAGNSAPALQTYTIAVVVDNMKAGETGYDVLSTLTLNTALSSPSCQAPTVASTTTIFGFGGVDKSLSRLATFTQAANTVCVYDYYARLALGSHFFPGSSLHANLANEQFGTAGIGARDVSIPIKEISPQGLRKDMTATASSSYSWNITKTATPNDVSFGDVCKATPTTSVPVKIRVEWTRGAAVAGNVTVTTNIYALNPAARSVNVTVKDVIYKGTGQTEVLDTQTSASTPVPARTEIKVLTHTVSLPASAGNIGDYLNDVATATYTDLITGIDIGGATTATASTAIVAGAVTDATANIADLEKIDLANAANTGLSFSVAPPGVGSFMGYTANTPTNMVEWGLMGQTTSGFVEFNKTINLSGRRIVTGGEMTDVATLVTSDSGFTSTAGPIYVNISSNAAVTLNLSKRIPVSLAAGERIEVKFLITRANDPSYQVEKTLTFTSTSGSYISDSMTGLVPDSYTVTEVSALFFAVGSSTGVDANLVPNGGPQRTVNLSPTDGVMSEAACKGDAEYVNVVGDGKFPKVQVQKVTFPALVAADPDYLWTFTLTGPGVPAGTTVQAGAGAPAVLFGVNLDEEGVYTVTETQKSPAWALTSAAPDPTAAKVCTITVHLASDLGKTFSCTFTNTKNARVKLLKTVLGLAPSGAQSFTFEIRKGASTVSDGTVLETQVANAANGGNVSFSSYLAPGTYQFCEVVAVGWSSTLGTFVPGSFMPPGTAPNPGADNSYLCESFTVAAGDTKTFTVDNAPPPGGRALTIGYWKNHASCKASGGKQAPVLDRTLAAAEPLGIQVDSFYLHGSVATPDVAPDCAKAVALLDKSDYSGKKRASDPLFNMTAQLVAAELNMVAGAYSCPKVVLAIAQANALLTKYGFNGMTYAPKLTSTDAQAANSLARLLDDYNNNRASACQ